MFVKQKPAKIPTSGGVNHEEELEGGGLRGYLPLPFLD
jgi:hypothetical protein